MEHKGFLSDVDSLLPANMEYNNIAAYKLVNAEIVALLDETRAAKTERQI